MKKAVALFLSLTLAAALLAGCGGGTAKAPAEEKAAEETKDPEPEETKEAEEEAFENEKEEASETEAEAEPTEAPHYKDIMVPYDELEPTNRLVILQNTLRNPRDGFYTPETAPVAEKINYNGAEVDAYPLTYTLSFLNNECQGDLTLTDVNGTAVTVAASDFTGMYAIIDDFQSGNPPTLYNPETGTAMEGFLYAVTAEGEGIYSVVTNTQYIVKDMVEAVGWDGNGSYTVCATDKFHIPVGPEYVATGDIRGTLSGAVSGSFGDLPIANGKIGDVVIIQAQQGE